MRIRARLPKKVVFLLRFLIISLSLSLVSLLPL